MPETFLILLAGGVMLGVAIPRPRDVPQQWLRLAGIVALAMVALAALFYLVRDHPLADMPPLLRRIQAGLIAATGLLALGQVACAQAGRPALQRVPAVAAFVVAVLAGSNLLHEMMFPRGTALLAGLGLVPPKLAGMAVQTVACAGVAAVTGLALAILLVGRAGQMAGQIEAAPCRRLNRALTVALALRAVVSLGAVVIAVVAPPVEMLWPRFGLQVGVRWVVGLVVPLVMVCMAQEPRRQGSARWAKANPYLLAVLVLIGESIALWLTRGTGVAF